MDLHIDLGTIKLWALILGIGIPIAGIVLAFVVKAVFVKVLILVVALGIGAAVWTQRAALAEYAETCRGKATFFGVQVDVPKAVRDACDTVSGA